MKQKEPIPLRERLLTLTEAQEYIGVRRTTFYRIRKSGKIKSAGKAGTRDRFRVEDLDEYLEQTRQK